MLDCLIVEALDHLIFSSSKVKLQLGVLDLLIFAVWRSLRSLDWLSKRALLDSI